MNKTARNSMIYLVGTITAALLGFVNTMVLTRILSEQVYAMYGLLTTFSTAIVTFIAFGYDSAYMRFYYNHGYTQKKFLWISLRLPLAVFVIVAIALIEPTRTLIGYIFGEKLSYVSILVLIGYIFFRFVSKFTHLTARMEERAGNYVISNIVGKSGFIAIVFLIYFLLSKVTFDWIMLSFLFTSMIAVAINLFVIFKVRNKTATAELPVKNSDLLSYGFPYMINNFLILVIPLIEKLIIRDLAGWEILGIYTAASVFQTVVLLLVNTITNIWNPIVFKHCDNEEKFKPILHNFGIIGAILLTLGTAACILLRRWLVLILDENYFSVYVIAPVILLSSCFNIMSLIYSVGINIKKKTVHLVIGPIIQLASSVALCYLLIPHLGLTGVGLAILFSVGVGRLYRCAVGLRLYNTGASEIKSVLLVIVSIVAAVISLFATSLVADVIMFFALCIALLVIVNKDLKMLCKFALTIIKPGSKKKKGAD